eukprot:SAG31_NODE_1312_length_8861_cov_10.803127_9_plen_95_part_00
MFSAVCCQRCDVCSDLCYCGNQASALLLLTGCHTDCQVFERDQLGREMDRQARSMRALVRLQAGGVHPTIALAAAQGLHAPLPSFIDPSTHAST